MKMSSDATAQANVDSSDIFLQTLAQAPDAVAIVDELDRVSFLNAAAERLFGVEAQAVAGRHMSALPPHPIEPECGDEAARELLVEQEDGTQRRVSVSTCRVTVAERALRAVFLRDVSGEHEAHEQLRQTLEQVLDAVVVIDEHNRITFFNRAAEILWGIPRADILGEKAEALFPRSVHAELGRFTDANGDIALEKVVAASHQVSIGRADGERRLALLSLSRVRVAGHVHYTALIKDVTEQRYRDEHLRQLSMVVNESDNGIIVTGPDGRIVYVNNGMTRMLGYGLAEIRGQRPSDLLTGKHTDPGSIRLIGRVLDLKEPLRRLKQDVLVYTKAGQPLWVSVVINSVHQLRAG
jgi:c-di-GMP-specific phosphodiesterase